jgi:hypothetical protein
MKSEQFQYKDFNINIKLILSALWTSVMFLYIYGDYFELYVPEKVEGLLNGRNILNTPYKLFFATIILTVPSLMIFLSLIMRAKWNRVLNISIGVFLSLFTLVVGVSSFSEWKMFYVMLSFLQTIITSTIVWKAWYWPKNELAFE